MQVELSGAGQHLPGLDESPARRIMNATSTPFDSLEHDLRACRLCLDAGYTIAPGAIFSHPPSAPVMLVGQAPGITEVEAQRPFNAGSGKRLFRWLEQAGWQEDDFRRRYRHDRCHQVLPWQRQERQRGSRS